MNFEMEYTPEQEKFRQEVLDFLARHVSTQLREAAAKERVSEAEYAMQRDFGARLAEKGWLYPVYPREFGGGGLGVTEALILEAEAHEVGLSLPPYYDAGGEMAASCIYTWGSDDQRQQFLPQILRGKARTWYLISEPETGSDWSNIQTLATREGDDYILNGAKVLVGSDHGADRFWMLAVTNQDAPRRENASWFFIDANLPGITITPMDLLSAGTERGVFPGAKNSVVFDNVRVPASTLVGGENNGSQITNYYLETVLPKYGETVRDGLWDRLADYCKNNVVDGVSLSEDEDIRDILIDIFIDLEITRLFGLRSMAESLKEQPRTYQVAQAIAFRKVSQLRISTLLQKLLGFYALTTDAENQAGGGYFEQFNRRVLADLAAGGTSDVQRSIMARRLGVGGMTRDDSD